MDIIGNKFEPIGFLKAVAKQEADKIRAYFKETAVVRWHNTNEEFNLNEFIRANCEYPGKWDCEVERIEKVGDLIITITRVFDMDKLVSVHATSFLKIEEGKIVSMDEYWAMTEKRLSGVWIWELENELSSFIQVILCALYVKEYRKSKRV